MTRYIEPEVRALRDDPTEGSSVELLLGVTPDVSGVQSEVESLGGRVDEELPFDTLRIELPETAISELCEVAGVESIEFEGEMEALDRGNVISLGGSNR